MVEEKKRRRGVARKDRVTPQRVKVQLRRTRIIDLYLEGSTQVEIEEKLTAEGYDGVSQSNISRDIAAAQQEWLERRMHDLDTHKGRELAKIDAIERETHRDVAEAQDAWRRSCEDDVETTKTTGVRGKSGSKTRTRRGVGDASILQAIAKLRDQVAWCISERCRILGLYAPKVREIRPDEAMRELAALLSTEPNLPD